MTKITRGNCTIHVHAKASRKGWTIFRADGGNEIPLGERKHKDDAIQFALDACEPGTSDTYHLRPCLTPTPPTSPSA